MTKTQVMRMRIRRARRAEAERVAKAEQRRFEIVSTICSVFCVIALVALLVVVTAYSAIEREAEQEADAAHVEVVTLDR